MTDSEVRSQYEGAILQQLIKNSEQLAVISPKVERIGTIEQKVDTLEEKVDVIEQKVDILEQKIDKVYTAIETVKWISLTIGIGIIINIFSQPILSKLF